MHTKTYKGDVCDRKKKTKGAVSIFEETVHNTMVKTPDLN